MLCTSKTKEEVPHGRVAGHCHLVNLLATNAQPLADLTDLIVEALDYGLVQLALKRSTIVGNPIHDVASAESLRVLEGSDRPGVATFQIHQFDHHGGGSQIHGQPVQTSPEAVDDLPVIGNRVSLTGHHRIQPQCLDRGCLGENLGFASQGREADIGAVIDDNGLAGQSVGVTQEGFAGASGAERLHPLPNFYNTFMTGAGAAAGCGHLDLQLIGVVEKRPASLQIKAPIIMPNNAHRESLPPSRKKRRRRAAPDALTARALCHPRPGSPRHCGIPTCRLRRTAEGPP